YTYDYYLTALDLELHHDEGLRVREDTQIYLQLYGKTLKLALVITLLCALLGYPLSYYLASLPEQRANLLLVLVLLPFWTSLLVRTTAWIALLQTNGVINTLLTSTGLLGEPLEMLYTSFATVVAMTHILLPFMVLPIYSVMRGIDPSYRRAALSLGARPLGAFVRIYFPMTLPGLSAGALLVFIISVGYYITPALVGGTDGQMISNLIAFHMQRSNNWELAAALGSLLLALILLLAPPGCLAAASRRLAGAAVPDPADPGDRAAVVQRGALLQLHRGHGDAAAGSLVAALVPGGVQRSALAAGHSQQLHHRHLRH